MKDVKSQASKNTASGKQSGLNAEIQSRIGHQLRAMYDDVVRQGVPDRFADLIRKLDENGPAGEQAAKKTGRAGGPSPPPSERTSWRRSQACARSRSRSAVTATAPTIWCRRPCCG